MPRYALIDDADPDLVYSGEWRQLSSPLNPKAPEFNGTVHATNDPNATITYNFYGTILNFFGSIDSPAIHGYPNASFTIQPDVFPLKHFNQSGTVPPISSDHLNVATSHIEMFRSGKFAEGNYTMTVKADGASADGATFYFDFLTVQCPDSVYVDSVILDDNDQQWDYDPGWITGNRTGDYLNTVHQTPAAGGTTTLGFHGTEIAVYGTVDGPYAEDIAIAYFKIDDDQTHTVLAGNVTKEVLLANGTEMQNQLIWRTTGLRDIGQGQHTITISVPPAANTSAPTSSSTTPTDSVSSSITPAPTNPPWFLDYVVYGPSSALTSRPTGTPAPLPISSPPPAGAIAGGVIGGLAGIALTIIGFLLWRRRQRAIAAEAEVQDEFKTNYATSTAASRPTLSGRRSSIHKGSRGRGGGTPGAPEGPVLDISATSPLASLSGHVGTSTMTGPGTADSAYETDYTSSRRPVPRPVREMDGGVRLASGSDVDAELVEVLPPSYARYSGA